MILLVGKTCSGKNTIKNEIMKMGMGSVVTYTTRPPRDGEIEGIDYHFISKEEFLEKEQNDFFAETTSYNVASGDIWYYGTAQNDLTDDKVLIVNPEGLRKIKEQKDLNPIAFYLTSNEDLLWNRLRQRGDDSAEARRRLKKDEEDFSDIYQYVDFTFRNDLGMSPKSLAEIISLTYQKVLKGGQVMNNHKPLKIYLAGKMSGLTYGEMNNWRIHLKHQLNKTAEYVGCNIVVINPVNYYNFEKPTHQTEEEIREFDLARAIESDIIIVNLNGLDSSDGTKIELHDCKYHKKIPVIAFGDRDLYDKLHPWVRLNITRVEKDIDGVCEYIKNFYMI